MASYDQQPGNLSLSFMRGDDFSAIIDVSINMTGFTTSAAIYSAVTGQQVMPFTVSTVSAADGKVNIALADTQTSSMARGTYTWKMSWTEGLVTRTALSGVLEVM